jgi:hypothetical protein
MSGYLFQKLVMGTLHDVPGPKEAAYHETLFGRSNSTYPECQRHIGRDPGPSLCQKRRIVPIATGHIDENPGRRNIGRFQQHIDTLTAFFNG